MKPSLEYVSAKFDEYNELIFAGRLPKPPILLSDSKSFLGICKSKIRHLPGGKTEHYDFQLRINTLYDLPENIVEDTIIHEMIHYFILLNGLKDSSPHGQIFKALMKSINTNYNRSITVSHRVTDAQRTEALNSKPVWHVIAAIHFKSGGTGVKVLPRVIPKIIDYYIKVSAAPTVESVTLHLHNNPFFNRYPTSAALRFHDIDRPELEHNLTGARKLIVNGNKLIQR